MKKIIMVSVIISIVLNITGVFVNVLETDAEYKTGVTLTTSLQDKKIICEDAISRLELNGIVEEPFKRWNSTDYISRRDAFKMAYIFNVMKRKFVIKVDEMSEDELLSELREAGYRWEPLGYFFEEYCRNFEFEDLKKGTFDYEFAVNLFYSNLLLGEEVNGKKYAYFDEYMTYEQAFATVCRMFSTSGYNAESWILRYYNDGQPINPYAPYNVSMETNPHYQFCIDTGLINNYSNPLYQYTLDVRQDQLGDKITAYEYMYIINEALYISSSHLGESYNCRRLSYFPIQISEDDDIVW